METRKQKERVKEIDEAIRRRLAGINRDVLRRVHIAWKKKKI